MHTSEMNTGVESDANSSDAMTSHDPATAHHQQPRQFWCTSRAVLAAMLDGAAGVEVIFREGGDPTKS